MIHQITSRVGFGTASLHHLHKLSTKLNLLDSAYNAGIRYFDTAPLYGHGVAERTLGQFIKRHHSQSEIVCATKVGLIPNPFITKCPKLLLPYIALRKITTASHLINPAYWQPKKDYSATYLTQRIENSLTSLGLDCLDIVLLHEPSLIDLQAIDNLNEAVLKLNQRGLIKHFGISSQIESAQWLKTNSPELAEIIQLELPIKLTIADKEWITNNATATFGHFRLHPEQQSTNITYLEQVAIKAVDLNPNGTILFSSTKNTHIDSFVSAITAADKKIHEVKGANQL